MKPQIFQTDGGLFYWPTKEGKKYFRRIEGGIIPPKRRPGIIAVVGEMLDQAMLRYDGKSALQEPKRYLVLDVIDVADLDELTKMAIQMKDVWWVDIFWLPKDEDSLCLQLQDSDGLTHYRDYWGSLKKVNVFDRQKEWPSYRTKDFLASIRLSEEHQAYLSNYLKYTMEREELKLTPSVKLYLEGRAGPEGMLAISMVLGSMGKRPLLEYIWEEEESEKERSYTNEQRTGSVAAGSRF